MKEFYEIYDDVLKEKPEAFTHWLGLDHAVRDEHFGECLKDYEKHLKGGMSMGEVFRICVEQVWQDSQVGCESEQKDEVETRRIYSVTIDEYNEAIDGKSRRFYRVDVNGPIGYAFKQSKNFDDLAGAYKYAKRVTGAWYDLSS